VKAELEFNQVEPGSYSSAAWVDTLADESSMKEELEGAQVESGSCCLSTWMGDDTHMEEQGMTSLGEGEGKLLLPCTG